MKKKKEVLIIIPAYNEEKTITVLLEQLEKPEISEIADVLVMNDASSDSTNWIRAMVSVAMKQIRIF